MSAVDDLLRAEIEPLQYGIFFGLLVTLAIIEVFVFRSPNPPQRKLRWPANVGLTILNIIVIGALPVSGLLVSDYAQVNDIGLLNIFEVAPLTALVIGLLFRSFISWLIHLAMHKVPLLWHVHRVHHTDTYIDISTTVRFHPIEFLINTPILMVSILLVGISPLTLMLYELFDTAMAIFTHANVRIPKRLERFIRFVLVTPDMHRVHHSTWQPETDSNYGATLSVWDHLFRTYRDKSPDALSKMQLGLTEFQDDRSRSLWWLLTLPFQSERASLGAHTILQDSQPTPEKGNDK
ncbi:sterol desaturase family protein [Hahella ganghwensis]|uniref:sterol desaturase family protein n=1 Tax=Hahella ganghwensis TaxID=286420 RepID=UPI000377FA6A|nr:sterol desaturase family protein [Hahella ganghwensis]